MLLMCERSCVFKVLGGKFLTEDIFSKVSKELLFLLEPLRRYLDIDFLDFHL
jgi:hypothetical protein